MSASIQVLLISLDFDQFQITRKAQNYYSGSFVPDTGTGFKACLKRNICIGVRLYTVL